MFSLSYFEYSNLVWGRLWRPNGFKLRVIW